ncbi:MAG: glycosyltransferase family 39 protein [Candidatus Levyibacteriota bacterium]
MSKFFNWKLILIFIIILAGFLRFYKLSSNPPSLTWDEAAWGYNAYSLGIDARDEFGRFLPYDYLESFGDFKPPAYAYLDILPIKIFGLNEFGVRFPSALFGVLTVLATYFLVRRIFPNAKKFSIFNFQFSIAEISAFILAISPWHILLSRAAFEANVATFFLVTGVWLFLAGAHEKKWCLPFSIFFFVLSLYAFNTSRIVAPLLVLLLMIGLRKQLLERKKEAIIACIVGVILVLPIARFLLSPQASLRFREVNIFSDASVIKTVNQEIKNDNNAFWSKIIHNRRFAYGVEYFKHYFDNLSPDFLFIKGDGNPKFSIQTVGQMYLWEIPFFIGGILFIFRKRQGYWWIVPFWLVLGIIPAATARETPHALRIETTLPTFQILTAIGLATAIEFLLAVKNKGLITKLLKLFVICYSLFAIFNFSYFYHDYFTHYPIQFSGEWQYGYKESIAFVSENLSKYDKVEITDALGRPYIYYLFYTKENPQDFRASLKVKRDVFGFVNVTGFGKYEFKSNLSIDKNTLFINSPVNVPKNAEALKTFYLLDGNSILSAYSL